MMLSHDANDYDDIAEKVVQWKEQKEKNHVEHGDYDDVDSRRCMRKWLETMSILNKFTSTDNCNYTSEHMHIYVLLYVYADY